MTTQQSSTKVALAAVLACFSTASEITGSRNLVFANQGSSLAHVFDGRARFVVEERRPQDCVRGVPVPILASTESTAGQGFEKLGDHEARERTSLNSGVELTVHQFGCEHYAINFTFVWKGEKVTERSPQGWLNKAAELLERVKVTTAQEKALRSMVETLRKSATRRYSLGKPLKMSEMETLTLKVEDFQERTRLNLLYDVAL